MHARGRYGHLRKYLQVLCEGRGNVRHSVDDTINFSIAPPSAAIGTFIMIAP